jgi:hypothetical protein
MWRSNGRCVLKPPHGEEPIRAKPPETKKRFYLRINGRKNNPFSQTLLARAAHILAGGGCGIFIRRI